MFERRLRFLLMLLVAWGAVLATRLILLQIVERAGYEALADAVFLRAPRDLAPVRGRILDRAGRTLASDEPVIDLCVHYGVLSMNPAYLRAMGRRLLRDPAWQGQSPDEADEEVRRRVRNMWAEVSAIGGVSVETLDEVRLAICRRVEAVARLVQSARGVRAAEEFSFHPILRNLTPAQRLGCERILVDCEFVRLESDVRRIYDVPIPLAQLIGRLGEVGPEDIRDSRDDADPLTGYRAGDLHGVSGVERLGEPVLRGRRGMETRNLDDVVVARVPPVDGRDIRLTLDSGLQDAIYEILAAAVAQHPPSTGAACVVLGLPSREVLALVSYPSFEHARLADDYYTLRDDVVRRPLCPRAVATAYPPGSIVKPLTMLLGLSAGVTTRDARIECRGRLFDNVEGWRCWTFWRNLPPHGSLDAVEAIQHSCNVYLYTIGQRLGPAALVKGMDRVINGENDAGAACAWTGCGLVEESAGLIPTPQRLGRGYRLADARNYAIGQGELELTPLQAATLMATLACGDYMPPTLISPPAPRRPRTLQGIAPSAWQAVREGMYRCANLPGGTAFPFAHMDAVVVCGKTGSAESVPIVTQRRYEFVDAAGTVRRIVAPTVEAAREALRLPPDLPTRSSRPESYWPGPADEKGKPPTHAWFAGFAPRDEPRIALALVIEYGGSGGRVAAPVGREVLETIVSRFPEYLPADGAYAPGDAAFPDAEAGETE